MGFFDKMKQKMDEEALQEALPLLMPNEVVELKFNAVEDVVLLTEKRLIILDKKGLSDGAAYISIPYSKINVVFIQKPGIGMFKFREIGVIVGSSKFEFKAPGEGLEVYQFLVNKTI